MFHGLTIRQKKTSVPAIRQWSLIVVHWRCPLSISVLTTTFYKSTEETRFHLASQLIGNAVAAGYDVLVVDGSPNPAIREAFTRIGARVYAQTARGMGPSRRELFQQAADLRGYSRAEVFVWTEPEKTDLIRLIPQLVERLTHKDADIIIPERTEASWQSYPAFQVVSEQKANAAYIQATGKRYDPMFGPVAYRGDVARYFVGCNPNAQFGAADGYIQHYAPLSAMAEGCKVERLEVDFYYPSVQRAEEESSLRDEMLVKREAQLSQLALGYGLAAKALGLPRV